MGRNCEKVYSYINELREVFNDEEINFIETNFESLKDSISENSYFDIVNACCTVLIKKRKAKLAQMDLSREMFSIVGYKDNSKDIVYLSELPVEERLKDEIEEDNTITREFDENIYKYFENAIFFDILNGESISSICNKYKLTKNEIKEIYSERLGFVKSLLVVDQDEVDKSIENRESVKSNVKIIINTK